MKYELVLHTHHTNPSNSIPYTYMISIRRLSSSASSRQSKHVISRNEIKENGSIRTEFLRNLKRICTVESADIATPKSRESARDRLRKARNDINAILATNKETRLGKIKKLFIVSNKTKNLNDLKKLNARTSDLLISLQEDRFETPLTLNSGPVHYTSVLDKMRKDLEDLARTVVDEKKNLFESDSEFIRQAYENTLCSVFSEAKDRFMNNPKINIEYIKHKYEKDIGDAAKSLGLSGTEEKGIFTPSGAGTNAFFSPVLVRAHKIMGTTIALPECKAVLSQARQFLIDAIKDKLPPDEAASIDQFKKMVADLDKKWLRVSKNLEASSKRPSGGAVNFTGDLLTSNI